MLRAATCSASSSGPSTRERHDFTIHAHGLKRAYRVDEVLPILTKEGLTGEEARRFVYAYEDGLALLRRYDEQAH